MKEKKKIIAILGTTASGKTSIGVHLANKFDGEIVSADSRQVYIGMDIGSGKDLHEYEIKDNNNIKKIAYHLIDVVKPNDDFNLAKYQKLANKAIDDILVRNKIPIIVGGTGLYAQSIIDGYQLSESEPNDKIRQMAKTKTTNDLLAMIKTKNNKFAEKINNSDRHNKRRLIRYLEILNDKNKIKKQNKKRYTTLSIALTYPKEILAKRIYKRIIQRLNNENMVGEVEYLHNNGISWQRLEKFGLEYKWIALYLQNKIDYDNMIEELYKNTKKFAKKQITWLKRWEKQGNKINWFNNKINYNDVDTLVSTFISK